MARREAGQEGDFSLRPGLRAGIPEVLVTDLCLMPRERLAYGKPSGCSSSEGSNINGLKHLLPESPPLI